MKKHDQQQYVKDMLEKGQAIQVLSESRRNGARGWLTRNQLHADEVVREERIKSILAKADELLVVALDPDTGKLAAFEIVKPAPELDFESDDSKAADAMQNAETTGMIHAERLHRAASTAERVIDDICGGTIKHYEELAAKIPSEVDSAAVMSVLAQARKPLMEVDTLKGRVKLGGVEHMKKALPCLETFTVIVDVREIDDDGKPNGSIFFKSLSVESTSSSLPPVLRSKARIHACLQTGSDLKSLALLHFAKYLQAVVKLELQMDYQIAEQQWVIKVLGILEQGKRVGNTPLTPPLPQR